MSRGDLQKQLSSVLQAIQSHDFTVEDVIAEDMRIHLPGLVELDVARDTIAELEQREKSLQARNDDLVAQLKAAKEADADDDQPEGLASLRIELQQANYYVEFLRKLADDAAKRSDRFESKLKEALSKQAVAESVSANMEFLQDKVQQQERAYQKLLQEHNEAAEANVQQRARYQHAFNAQQAHLQATIDDQTTQLAAARDEIARIESEALAISEAHTSLIDSLEADHASVSAAVNNKTMQLHKTAMMHDALQSTLAPLDHFFRRTVQILDVYQALFRNLSDPACPVPTALPRSLESSMQLAVNDLMEYQHAAKSPDATHALQGRVGEQLAAIASHAGLIFEYLDVIQSDVTKFLGRQHAKSPRGLSSNMGIASRMKRFSFS